VLLNGRMVIVMDISKIVDQHKSEIVRILQPVHRVCMQLLTAQWTYLVFEGPLLQTILVVYVMAYCFLNKIGHLECLKANRTVLTSLIDLIILFLGSVSEIIPVTPFLLSSGPFYCSPKSSNRSSEPEIDVFSVDAVAKKGNFAEKA